MTVAEARAYVSGLRTTNQHRKTYWYVVVARNGAITGHAPCLTRTAAISKSHEFADGKTQIAIVAGSSV